MERLQRMKLPEEPLSQEMEGLQLMAAVAIALAIGMMGGLRVHDVLSSVLLGVFVAPWAAAVVMLLTPISVSRLWSFGWSVRLAAEFAMTRVYAIAFRAAKVVASVSEESGFTHQLLRGATVARRARMAARRQWSRCGVPDAIAALKTRWRRRQLRKELVREIYQRIAAHRGHRIQSPKEAPPWPEVK
jgi:hypothetical protein